MKGQNKDRIVIKIGTSTLAHKTGLINLRRVEKIVRVISDIKNSGKEVVIVTSGAIGVGAGKLKMPERPRDIPSRQACASVGQVELMYIYDKLFSEYNHTVAQVLLTRDVLDSGTGKHNAVNIFERLLSMSVIPVVNENDAVSTEEIEFGDNDRLSAIVGELTNACHLIILTDTDGLYDKPPRENEDARLIDRVYEINDDIRALAGTRGSTLGTGGMITKLLAAEMAMKADFSMSIINGRKPELLYDLMDGKCVGTLFKRKDKE